MTYTNWTEDQLYAEIRARKIYHGVCVNSFPDDDQRKARLIEILEHNDRFRATNATPV